MEAKEKAKELVDKFMPYMYCYMGSGMLSNDYDINVALSYAKKCAIIAIDECITALRMIDDSCFEVHWYNFYENVKKEIEQL